MFCCLKGLCLNGVFNTHPPKHVSRESQIKLQKIGHEVVIIKGGLRACGSGGALGSSPLVQSKSYFEVKIQQAGKWSVGLATENCDLNNVRGGQDSESWCLTSDNIVYHDKKEIHELVEQKPDSQEQQLTVSIPDLADPSTTTSTFINQTGLPQEGDTIGVAYDHVELNFYLNGKNLNVPVLNIKSTVYPVIYVDDGAIVDLILDNFNFNMPAGFEKIMIEQSLL
uniref:SPRY domain-containing protein 7 n=1 Tax=Corethrella appendiculata TaxID=1370023 RepID=U5EPW6_9DIPT